MNSIAVVIIGRNEGPSLELCIDSVLALQHPDFSFDTIYVDSDSTDDSVALAKSAGIKTIVLRQPQLTAALARNTGWRATSGDFVLFLDGDTTIEPGFLPAALQAFSDPRVAAVCGQQRERHPEASLFNRVADLDWNRTPGLTDYCGGNALFRRQALVESGGYDPNLVAGEEPDLCTRLRLRDWKILALALPMSTHDLDMTTFTQYWGRAQRSGYAYAELSERFRHTTIPLWSREAAHNRRQVRIFSIFLATMALSALTLRAWFPLEITLLAFLLLVLRTAWKFRAKSSSVATLLLYGLNSHLQQFPIYLGQRRFYRETRELPARNS